MQIIKKKYTVRIPNENKVLYHEKKKLITVIGPISTKSLKLKLKIKLSKNFIIITKKTISNLPYKLRNNIAAVQGTTVSLIKQLFVESTSILYQKLKLVGVGYKAFDVEKFKGDILKFKLGYSHFIYFKIPKNLKYFCLKLTKIFIYGSSYTTLTQTSALIKSYKFPDPYKGKGILYDNEKIKLKEGKKI